MALLSNPIPSLSVCLNGAGSVMTFLDTTGEYDEVANPNGWGGPSGLDISCADVATVTIVDPSGDETAIDVSATWPDTTGVIPVYHYVIPTGDTEPEQFIDGIYTIYYAVSSTGAGACDPDTLQIGTHTIFVYTKLKECIGIKVSELTADQCDCDRDKLNQLLYLRLLYKAFQSAACCGNMNKAQALYDRVLRICQKNLCIAC